MSGRAWSWTEEQGALCKRMWADGQSATQIAAVLPGKTRNGVIGWLHRHGETSRTRKRLVVKRHSPPPRRQPSRPPHGAEVARRVARATLKRTYVPPSARVATVVPAREPRGPHVHMVDLHDGSCRWPVGAWIIGEGYLFCGAAVTDRKDERPYCTYHAAQAFPALKGRAA